MIRYLFCVLIVVSFNLKAQNNELCVDSVKVSSIPLRLATKYNVHFNELSSKRGKSSLPISVKSINDQNKLGGFCKINLSDTSLVFQSDTFLSADDLDARKVIEVYCDNKKSIIVIDSRGFSFYGGVMYRPNIQLISWIDEVERE